MVDEATSGGEAVVRCQWCSAPLPAPDAVTCPSCGAALTAETDAQLPGVTAVDAEAIARATRAPVRQPRNRLLSWISGEYAVEDSTEPLDALAPPDGAVRREILRLQLEAEIAARRAEQEALFAEAVAEGRALPAGADDPAEDAPTDGPTPPEQTAPPAD